MSRSGQCGQWKYPLAVSLFAEILIVFPVQAAIVSGQDLSRNSKVNLNIQAADVQILASAVSSSFKVAPSANRILEISRNEAQLEPQFVAQVPNPITPRTPEPAPLPAPQAPPTPQLEPAPTAPTQPRPEVPGTIVIKRFDFQGSSVFSVEQLRQRSDRFTNKPITFAELLQVESEITNLYVEAGYLNSGAVIQAQTIKDGVVVVQIIEGSVEDIRVAGTRRLNPAYIRSRLGLAVQKPLNRNRLLEALQLLQLDPLIQSVSAELSAGARADQSLLEVRISEAKSFRADLFADNGRTPSVGSFRRGVRLFEGNLLGIGDRASARYTNTQGSNALDLSYEVPVSPHEATVALSGGFSRTRIVEEPFDLIDIRGNSNYINLDFRQPILRTPTQEFALGISLSRQESQTSLLDEDFPLSPGADENGRTRISAVRFFQDYVRRSSVEVFALRSQFSLGVGALNATINDEPPDSRFFAWRGQGQYVRRLGTDSLFVLRSDVQLANRALLPLEQFALGGFQSVRGYRQDLLLTDNGVFASAEVRLPVFRAPRIEGVLQIIPFLDFGIGWNSSGRSNPDRNILAGAGVGLQWQMGDRLNARIDYGIPLNDAGGDRGDTLQEKGFYFSVNYSPF